MNGTRSSTGGLRGRLLGADEWGRVATRCRWSRTMARGPPSHGAAAPLTCDPGFQKQHEGNERSWSFCSLWEKALKLKSRRKEKRREGRRMGGREGRKEDKRRKEREREGGRSEDGKKKHLNFLPLEFVKGRLLLFYIKS